MSKVTWPPRSGNRLGAADPQRFALNVSGRRVGFVRELATMDGYRVSLVPGGHTHAPRSAFYARKTIVAQRA